MEMLSVRDVSTGRPAVQRRLAGHARRGADGTAPGDVDQGHADRPALQRGQVAEVVGGVGEEAEQGRGERCLGPARVRRMRQQAATLEQIVEDRTRALREEVSERQRAEDALRAAKDEAVLANRAKGQFLALVSHELRTPINAIVGFSEVLSAGQSEHLSVPARREYLGTILESAKHLQGLINEILEATRIERGTLQLDEQPNDAAELIEVVAKIVRDQATQARISVVARVVEDVEVTGDLTRLKQVILNILSNAIKFSPEGGVVNMDMLRAPNGDLLITVRDAGIGISDEDAERVFEPFVQVENGSNRRFGGMGLGLSNARRIAQLHGGSLTLKGQSGSGTEARLTLPATRVRWPKPKAKTQGNTAAA